MLEFSRMTLRNRTLWDNRHPEDKHLSKICSDKFPKCRLPSLEVAAEFQNQHDWNKTEPDKLNCFKPLRKDPIGFHRPGELLITYTSRGFSFVCYQRAIMYHIFYFIPARPLWFTSL